MTINLANYWPTIAETEQLLIQDATAAYGPETLSVLHRFKRGPAANKLILDDYVQPTGWIDAWSLTKGAAGVIETSDRFGGQNLVFKAGKEIPWGGLMNVGDTVSASVEVNVPASTGVTAGPGVYGYQSVKLAEVIPSFTNGGGLSFTDVAKLEVFQSWCKTNTCDYPAGQNVYRMNYWMAPGVGFIQIEYLEAPAPFSPRLDYAKSLTRTVLMP